jgi:hypothetical protein
MFRVYMSLNMTSNLPGNVILIDTFLSFQIGTAGNIDKLVLFSRKCKRHFKRIETSRSLSKSPTPLPRLAQREDHRSGFILL